MGQTTDAHTDTTDAPNPAWPPADAALLARVANLLRDGKSEEALALAPAAGSPWVRNARGVCLLRLGRAAQAVEALRDLVFDRSGFAVRADADPTFQANYAAALLLDGNADGFWDILGGIRDRSNPAVARLDDAVGRWKAGRPWGHWLRSLLGAAARPLALDFPPGDL